MMTSTTMKDVARVAGVSSSTVSRVLSGAVGVRPVVRDRVRAAVDQLAYRPNQHASNLRRQTSRTIGVVVSAIENPYFAEAVRAIEDILFDRGFRVLLCNTDSRPAKQQAYLQTLAAERVQGIILVPSDPAAPEIGQVIDRGIPIVAFDRPLRDRRASAVVVDNAGGAEQATAHLIANGHGGIGFILGRPGLQPTEERLTGYLQAMQRAQLTPCVVEGWSDEHPGRAATFQLIDAGGITACVVTNSALTMGVLAALRERRCAIPAEMAIAMFEEPPWANLMTPGLTAIAIPVQRMAEGAVRLLLDQQPEPAGQPRIIVYNPELHVRESSGPTSAG